MQQQEHADADAVAVAAASQPPPQQQGRPLWGQQLQGLAQQLQAALTPDALQAFFEGWDAVGGGPCTGLRQQAVRCMQAATVPWAELLLAAEALQEVCWEKLHTGHWQDVDVAWRDAYALFSALAVLAQLAVSDAAATQAEAAAAAAAAAAAPQPSSGLTPAAHQQHAEQQQQLGEALRRLDLAAMMGGLRFRRWADLLLGAVDEALLAACSSSGAGGGGGADQPGAAAAAPARHHQQQHEAVSGKRAREADDELHAGAAAAQLQGGSSSQGASRRRASTAGQQQGPAGPGGAPSQPPPQPAVSLPPGSLTPASAVIPVHHAPPLEHFLVHIMMREGGPVPVVLRGVMDAWPALSKWQDLSYISQVAGRRTVPVEVGSHYLAEGWGSRLMTIDTFLAAAGMAPPAGQQQPGEQHQQPAVGASAAAAAGGTTPSAAPPLHYLAQHQLFDQVPALARDIVTPDYCSVGEAGGASSVNAWFGPPGTVTPLHQDPEHNLLAQVVGTKYVRLYDPALTPQLYPHSSGMHTNASRVDVGSVDEAAFPGFSSLPFVDVVLQPGDMLFMPARWWHYVKSLAVSFSVSFWWS